MRQICLCSYLRTECNHKATFLHLPPVVRERIYLYFGLPQSLRYNPFNQAEDFDDVCVLRRICKTIGNEAEGFVLAHNTLWLKDDYWIRQPLVRKDDYFLNQLHYLRSLTPWQCSQLHDMRIRLNRPCGVFGHVDGSVKEHASWWLVHQWQQAAGHFLQHIKPQQVRLRLLCDVGDDMAKAKAIVAPFRLISGKLLDLELRLSCNKRNKAMRQFAYETVIDAVGSDPSVRPGVFRFLDLPSEVQRHIFSYTPLLTPYRNLLWTPSTGFQPTMVSCTYPPNFDDGDEDHDEEWSKWICPERLTHHHFAWDKKHKCMSRYAGFSFRCRHGSGLSLMLANRAMYEEVMDFVLDHHHITVAAYKHPELAVLPRDPFPLLGPCTNDRGTQHAWMEESCSDLKHIQHDATKLFVERVSPGLLQRIRTLEIVMPRATSFSTRQVMASVYTEWPEALELMAKHVNISRLTLSVHLFTSSRYLSWEHTLTHMGDFRQIYYRTYIMPLRRLAHLKRLFVHLEWPKHWASRKLQDVIDRSGVQAAPVSRYQGFGGHFIPPALPQLVEEEAALKQLAKGVATDGAGREDETILPAPWLRDSWDFPSDLPDGWQL